MERDVTLPEMLEAREARVLRQQALLTQYACPVVSFCLNIAGPVKDSPLLRRTFQEGVDRLEAALTAGGMAVLHRERRTAVTGCEGLWAVRGDGRAVKALCTELEDGDALGRLFDLDVLDPACGKWDRTQLGLSPRPCLVCGQAGKGCASRRLHPVEELQRVTADIQRDFFARSDRKALAALAARALLYEVCTTPKPGLVDRNNNGSHRDMDLFTFVDSTAALLPYFEEAAALGQAGAGRPPEEVFSRLRRAGVRAEKAMFRATGGVNTHKGAVFSLGTVCAAAGRLWTPEGTPPDPERLLQECAALSAGAVRAEFAAMEAGGARDTAGRRLYLERGLTGIRGEVALGLPSVARVGLPALEEALRQGAALEQAGVSALLHLMALVTDTNLIARGGPEGQRWAAEQAARLTSGGLPSPEQTAELDWAFIGRNLSPGGCADLLAITYFIHFLTQRGGNAGKEHSHGYDL